MLVWRKATAWKAALLNADDQIWFKCVNTLTDDISSRNSNWLHTIVVEFKLIH